MNSRPSSGRARPRAAVVVSTICSLLLLFNETAESAEPPPKIANTAENYSTPAAPAGIEYWDPKPKGHWALTYEYQRIKRKDNREGKQRLSVDEVAELPVGYTDIPDRMDTDVHTFGFEMAVFSRLTISLKVPLLRNQMRVVRANVPEAGSSYDWESSGIGDMRLVGIVPFMKKGRERLHFHLGLMMPTGSVNDIDAVPAGETLLPYPMQTGGGTWNMLFGLTYLGGWRDLGWGVQANGLVRMGHNEEGWRLGNNYQVTGWLAHNVTRWLSGSLRMAWDQSTNIGGDMTFGPPANPASDGYLHGGGRLGIGPGVTFAIPVLGEQRLSVEMVWPVYQDLDGPQLERDWTLSTGWSWIF